MPHIIMYKEHTIEYGSLEVYAMHFNIWQLVCLLFIYEV